MKFIHILVICMTALITTSVSINADERSNVKLAQSYLNALGFSAGAEDGIWGKKTRSALINFLDEQGIIFDEMLGEDELSLLKEAFNKLPKSNLVSTKISENNFCNAKDGGNSAYKHYLLNNHDAYRFDYENLLPTDRPLFLDYPSFVKLNSSDTYFMIAGIGDDTVPNISLPIMIGEPFKHPKSIFGYGKDVGLTLSHVNLNQTVHELDLDGDGDDDLIFVDYGDHDINEKKGGFIYKAIYDSNARKYKVSLVSKLRRSHHRSVVVDLDRDGDYDIVTAGKLHGKRGGNVSVFVNDGGGQFQESRKHLRRQPSAVWFVDAADFNADGFPDIVLGGWDTTPHYVLFDNKTSGRKLKLGIPGDQELLSMVTRAKGEVTTAYFLTTNDYKTMRIYRVRVQNEKQLSSDKVLEFTEDDQQHGRPHPNIIYGCEDGIYYFKGYPKSHYHNKKNGFTFLTKY